jgi:hypothetical protein
MSRKILALTVALVTFSAGSLTTVAEERTPRPKIGVIMHDHGAPREHNAESYYGMKYFLKHMVGMGVIPQFVRTGFSFDPNQGNWGVMLMDKNDPMHTGTIPWADLELVDAWGNDLTWLKDEDADPLTPEIEPIIELIPVLDPNFNYNYGNVVHYRLPPEYEADYPTLLGFGEQDFDEFVGHDFRWKWMTKGGVEVYFDQVGGQRENIRDALWAEYKQTLSGGDLDAPDAAKDEMIRITWGIDPNFPNTDPTTSIHAQSLFDSITQLTKVQGAEKIIINRYFMFMSEMMNDAMDAHTVHMAKMALMADGYEAPEIIWAPAKTPIGEASVPIIACDNTVPPWNPDFGASITGYEQQEMFVGGVALEDSYLEAVADKVELELAKMGSTTGDVAMFLSNHGTNTDFSHCWDSGNDYLHYNYKLAFIRLSRLLATRLGATPPVFGPQAPGEVYGDDLLDIAILGQDIQYATTTLPDGRAVKFYRVAAQKARDEEDSGQLQYSPREALLDVIAAGNYSNVLDLLYNFFGDSSDLLYDHRIVGYGHEDPEDALGQAAYEYCNPEVDPGELTFAIHDCSKPDYAGLEPYESDFDWSGVHVRITNASWAFPEKEAAVENILGVAIADAGLVCEDTFKDPGCETSSCHP